MEHPQLTHYIIAYLVNRNKLSLWEVDEKYDLNTIIQLYEIVVFDEINKVILERK